MALLIAGEAASFLIVGESGNPYEMPRQDVHHGDVRRGEIRCNDVRPDSCTAYSGIIASEQHYSSMIMPE